MFSKYLFNFLGPWQDSTESSVCWSSVNNAIKLTFYLSELFSLCYQIFGEVISPSTSQFFITLYFFLVFSNPWAKCHKFEAWKTHRNYRRDSETKMCDRVENACLLCKNQLVCLSERIYSWVTYSGSEDLQSFRMRINVRYNTLKYNMT